MKNRILVLHLNMKVGGVEKQLLNWINNIPIKNEVTLLLCKKEGELLKKLHPEINIVEIGKYPKFIFDPTWLYKTSKIIHNINPIKILLIHSSLNFITPFIKNNKRNIYLSVPGFPKIGKLFILHRYLYSLGTKVICVSSFIEKYMNENWNLHNTILIRNSAYIPDTILNSTDIEYKKEVNEYINVITVSRIDKNKNVIGIIHALNTIIERNYKIKLTVVGDGPELDKCIKLSNSLNLQNHVTFLGSLTSALELIKQSDLLILNSKSEGQPTVVLESWALKTIVLSNCYSGIDSNFMIDKYNAILNNDGTEGLVNKILEFINMDNSSKQTIINNAYKCFVENHSIHQYTKHYQSLMKC